MEIIIYDLPLVVGLIGLALIGIKFAHEIGRSKREQ
jgi:hypothetical protein